MINAATWHDKGIAGLPLECLSVNEGTSLLCFSEESLAQPAIPGKPTVDRHPKAD